MRTQLANRQFLLRQIENRTKTTTERFENKKKTMSRCQFLFSFVLAGVVVSLASGEKSASTGCRILQDGKKLHCKGLGLSKLPEIRSGILIA